MFVWELLIALILALLFVGLLVGLVGWGRPDRGATSGTAALRDERSPATAWGVILFLFVILFLGIWAGGAWIEPFGPEAWGVAWLPFLFVALVLALIVVAVAPPTRRTPPVRPRRHPAGGPGQRSGIRDRFRGAPRGTP